MSLAKAGLASALLSQIHRSCQQNQFTCHQVNFQAHYQTSVLSIKRLSTNERIGCANSCTTIDSIDLSYWVGINPRLSLKIEFRRVPLAWHHYSTIEHKWPDRLSVFFDGFWLFFVHNHKLNQAYWWRAQALLMAGWCCDSRKLLYRTHRHKPKQKHKTARNLADTIAKC